MKKRIRRLRLERDTIRNLTPQHLEGVAGGRPQETGSTGPSCEVISLPRLICNSCVQFQSVCC